MDVDLLRPGNVPISPNTVLWFEFLLNPNLLEEHLEKPNPDPVPSDLLIKFLTLSVEPSSEEISENTKNFKCTKRALSMKILALKIVAFWKWNLEMIETKLPLQLQYVLLRDLLCLSSDEQSDQNLFAPTMHLNLIVDQLRDEQIFAIALYHRWALHIIVNSSMVSKNILCSTTSNVESADEIMSKIMDDETKSEILLQRIVKLKKDFIICPTFYNFSPPTEYEEMKQDWENGLKMSMDKFFAQIYYELGMFKIYGEAHGEAVDYFTRCKTLHDRVNIENDHSIKGFFEIDEASLKGFCHACGISTDEKRNLTLQFYAAIRNNYSDIISILQMDNQQREIPLSYRDSLELDLASNLASGKFTASRDLLFHIQTLNVIRRLVEGAAYPSVLDYVTKLNTFRKGGMILTKALKRFIGNATSEEKLKIRSFLLMLFGKCDFSLIRSMIAESDFCALFSETELNDIRKGLETDINDIPQLKENDELDEKKMKLMGSSQLELSLLELQIIRTYNPIKLKELIVKFVSISNGRPVIDIYNKWKKFFICEELKEDEQRFPKKGKEGDRHIQCDKYHVIGEAILRLPNQFLQQYNYSALAKVRELLELQKYDLAREFISVAGEDLKKNQFLQLLSWETLYVNMIELQVNWPATHINRNSLATSCKNCLLSFQQRYDPSYRTSQNFSPRDQLGEQCALTLLNIERDYLVSCNFPKPMRYLKLFSALSVACKKSFSEAWNFITPSFLSLYVQRKKAVQFVDRDGCVCLSKTALTRYFTSLRDTKVINVVLSLLSRLHNVLRDEPNLELYFAPVHMWPSTISNTSGYNLDAVLDMLAEILDVVLKYQPNNYDWLKLGGDIYFVKEHYSSSLKRYLEALASSTDYFVRIMPKTTGEDVMYRRMIKCCSMLQSYTQAAILCQFLDEVDYATAFKCLSEGMCADASDCYYDCIWDVNILEYLVSLHTKRNEHCKKQKVIDVVGLLELNSNNNEEIKREASNARKMKFLRALTKQYVTR